MVTHHKYFLPPPRVLFPSAPSWVKAPEYTQGSSDSACFSCFLSKMEIILAAFYSPLRMLSGLIEWGILSSYFLRERHWVKYRILFYQRPALIISPTTGTKGMYHFTPILTAIILIQLSQNLILEASLVSGTIWNNSRLMAWIILNIIYSLTFAKASWIF